MSVREEIVGLAGALGLTVRSQAGSVVNTRGCLAGFESPCDTQCFVSRSRSSLS